MNSNTKVRLNDLRDGIVEKKRKHALRSGRWKWTSSLLHAAAILSSAILPSTAWAQEAADKLNQPGPSPRPGEWTVTWAASAEQGFQIDRDRIVDLDPKDVQDEGEYTLGATLKGAFPRFVEISFSPLVTINPYLFDEREESSAWSVAAQIRRKIEMPGGVDTQRGGRGAILPFAAYKYGRSFTGVFDGEETDDRTITVGASFMNFLCVRVRTDDCDGAPKAEYKLTLSYFELDSSNNDNDMHGPKLRIEWKQPAFPEAAVWLDASAEARTYDSLSADGAGGVAEAARYSVAVGVDFSGWARRTLGFSEETDVGIGLRWVRVEANRADLEREDFAVIPTVSWKH